MTLDIIIKLDPQLQQTITYLADSFRGISHTERLQIMASLQDLKNQVSSNTSLLQSGIQLIQGLAKRLQDALNANDPAAIQDIVNELQQSDEQFAAALAANTPAETISKQG